MFSWVAGDMLFGMGERVKNFLWYTFVFLLPWQTVWIFREVFVDGEKWQYATIGMYVSDIVLVAFAIFFYLCASRETWRELSRDVFVRIFVALLAWSLLSTLWAINRELALLSVWRVFLMTLVYVCMRYGGVSFRKTIAMFLFSMTVQAGLALSQWVSQFVFSSSLFGIAQHDPSQWGTFVLKTESGRFLRAYGGFEHPNVLGGALAMAILFGVWLSVTARRLCVRVALLGMTVVSSFALVVTFSRSAWMALGCGGGVLFLGLINLNRRIIAVRKVAQRLAISLFFVGTSFSLGFLLVRDIAMSRFSDETLAREGSLSDRAVYMEQALVAIREHPILGVGGGNFTAFSMERFPDAGAFVGAFQPVHMVPILVFVELGVIGFVLFLLLFAFGFARAWKQRNVLSLSILFALVPMLLIDHWLWSGHFGALFLGFLLGVCARDDALLT
ncbi:MAG: O-antigen ligase family protein [Candidatus Moraniibacteriota bacterium]|nr:MAG: O-antigen ligase family protein [Candidatus Moranbacteria bacterium]